MTTARFDQAGVYVLRLSASDGRATDFDDVAVMVLPAPPGPPPFVEIASPLERSAVTDFTDVIGTVRSEALLSWRLEKIERLPKGKKQALLTTIDAYLGGSK